MRSDKAREALKSSPPSGRRSDKAQRADSPDDRCCAHGLVQAELTLHAVCAALGLYMFCTAQPNILPSSGRWSDKAQHADSLERQITGAGFWHAQSAGILPVELLRHRSICFLLHSTFSQQPAPLSSITLNPKP